MKDGRIGRMEGKQLWRNSRLSFVVRRAFRAHDPNYLCRSLFCDQVGMLLRRSLKKTSGLEMTQQATIMIISAVNLNLYLSILFALILMRLTKPTISYEALCHAYRCVILNIIEL